ncbi:MAG: hypothetical protein V1907_02075, partial [Candidatus Kerfeldbacteria bacterium]
MKNLQRHFGRRMLVGIVSAAMLAPFSVMQNSAAATTLGPYGFTGTITHTFLMDQTTTGEDITDTFHDTGSITQTVAADGSATVTTTTHSTEVIDSLVECLLGATVTGSYNRHDVITTDGSGTSTLPAKSVSIIASGSSYTLNAGLTSESDHVDTTSVRVITFSGGSGDCQPPAGQTITSDSYSVVNHDDSATVTPVTSGGTTTFTGSISHLDEYNPTQTIGMSWNLSVYDSCGERLGAQWIDRYPMPYTDEAGALAALKPSFGNKVQSFIAALRSAGATVTVKVTFRPQARAYLMANAWAIAKLGKDPRKIKAYPGVNSSGKAVKSDGETVKICWYAKDSNGAYNKTETLKLANKMVKAYGITGTAAYPSKHTERTAIDMTVSWDKKPLK